MIRTAWAFIKRDFLVTISYRFNFILKIAIIFFGVAALSFIGGVVDRASFPFLDAYGGSYFGFLLIGVLFGDYLGISINSFSNNIRDGQLTGTLEIILTSPTRLSTFLISSSLFAYIFTSVRIMLYILTGLIFFNLEIGNADLFASLVIFLISMVCYVAIGIIYAALVLVVKRGEAVLNVIGGISLIISGVFFPPDVLPGWIEGLSRLIPFTYSLRGLRLSILEGQSLSALRMDVLALTIFSVIFVGISILSFPYALKQSKINGTLSHY